MSNTCIYYAYLPIISFLLQYGVITIHIVLKFN